MKLRFAGEVVEQIAKVQEQQQRELLYSLHAQNIHKEEPLKR